MAVPKCKDCKDHVSRTGAFTPDNEYHYCKEAELEAERSKKAYAFVCPGSYITNREYQTSPPWCPKCKVGGPMSLTDELNAISDQVFALEQENEQLKAQPALTFEQQYLFDLCGQMAEAWRPRFDSLAIGLQEIIKTYDKIIKSQLKEGDLDCQDGINDKA